MGLFDGLLDKFGGTIVGAMGDDAAIGFLFTFMEDIEPYDCYEIIRDNKPLFPDVSREDWQKYGKLARQAGLQDVDSGRIMLEFRKYRPDLLSVVLNHPKGLKWLDDQVVLLRQKLGL